ncbi:hypothetical protein HYR99_40135 [Candidatus Poribacteria bacterium]|nr:hypothetical protein [Candidatus Poribacteria bacterium]
MAETRDDTLRALIRLIPPARALKEDLERSLHLEIYAGTGNMAVKSYQGIQASVARITDDPYVATLSLDVPENATDKEKVSLVRLAAGQLVAYLEGYIGLVGIGGEGHGRHGPPMPAGRWRKGSEEEGHGRHGRRGCE